jgi:hypothetical protein
MKMARIFILLFLVIVQFAPMHAAEKADSTLKLITTWKTVPYSLDKVYLPLDTFLFDIQTTNPILHRSFSNTFTGNLGGPSESNIFAYRRPISSFIFLAPEGDYMLSPEKVIYYSTNKPFTTITYSTGGSTSKAEQTIKVVHTQNINRDLNVGLNYHLINSVGQYLNQSTRCNSFTFFSSFEHPNYSWAMNLNYNKFIIEENGGLAADSILSEGLSADAMSVKLSSDYGTATSYRNLDFYFIQRYIVGRVDSKLKRDTAAGVRPMAGLALPDSSDTDSAQAPPARKYYQLAFSHVLGLDRGSRGYKDKLLAGAYYKDWLVNSATTYDSVFYRKFYNMFRMELLPDSNNLVKLGAMACISSEDIRYNMDAPDKVIVTNSYVDTSHVSVIQRKSRSQDNFYLSFQLFDDVSKTSNWGAEAKYCFEGYNMGAKELNAHLYKNIGKDTNEVQFKLSASYNYARPDYLYQYYYSNHFSWDKRSEFKNTSRGVLDFNLTVPYWKLNAGANYTLLTRWTYLTGISVDSLNTAVPVQSGAGISILTGHLEKTISFWKMQMVNKLAYQKTSSSAIHLPDLTYYNSTYFESTVIKNVLDIELGVELFWFTKFYMDGYMPGLGMFYQQNEKALGNYPLVNVFFNFKLKRARVFLKMDHVNSGLSGSGYFSAYHYPMSVRMFKFGVSWSFYD